MKNHAFRWNRIVAVVLAVIVIAPAPLWTAPAQGSATPQTSTPPVNIYLPVLFSNIHNATSAELIQSALERGEIDYFTSLLYRLYAQFGDDRLPSQMFGVSEEDLGVFHEASKLLPTLPSEKQAQLNAFLVYPDDPSSVWSQDQVQAQGAQAEVQPAAAPCWVAHKSTAAGVNIKVWAACDANAEADVATALGMMNDLWGPMTALMGQPLPDAGDPGSGGSTDIDVYLLLPLDLAPRSDYLRQVGSYAGAVAPMTNPGVSTSSGYMLMRRDGMAQAATFKSTLAHEFFHVLQHAHNYQVHFNQKDEEWWFTESSATWAAVNFVPENRTGIHNYFSSLFQYSLMPLNLREKISSPRHLLLYASYIWPFFMEMELGPESIAQAWDKIALVGPDQDAADFQLDLTLSFDLNFHRFAIRNLNMLLEQGDPVSPRYVTFDPAFPDGSAPILHPSVLSAGQVYMVGDDLPRLKANYYQVLLDELSVKSVAVRLTTGSSLDLDVLMRKNGNWTLQNFSGQTEINLCDVEKLYIVVSNPAFATDNHVPYSLEVEAKEDPCSCNIPKVAAFNGSVSFDYTFAANNAEYSYTIDEHASGISTPTLAVDELLGRSYQGIVNGTGSLNDIKVRAGNPPLISEEIASGPLVPSVNPELLSYAAINISLTRCAYNVYFSADVAHGEHTLFAGAAHTGWMPIPENLVLSGDMMIDGRSESWGLGQRELSPFYSIGGFGDDIFFNVIGMDNPAGQARYIWNFSPAQ